MCKIRLSSGELALVDPEDFNKISQLSWYYVKGYARTSNTKKLRKLYKFELSTSGVYMHRLVLSAPEGFDVDHINGDTLDNRKSNLRLASRSQNIAYSKVSTYLKTSKYKGVYFDARRSLWSAEITKSRVKRWLGYYTTEENAAKAYDRAASHFFGEFALFNFPEDPQKFLEPPKPKGSSVPEYFGVMLLAKRKDYVAKYYVNDKYVEVGGFTCAYDAAFYRELQLDRSGSKSKRNF